MKRNVPRGLGLADSILAVWWVFIRSIFQLSQPTKLDDGGQLCSLLTYLTLDGFPRSHYWCTTNQSLRVVLREKESSSRDTGNLIMLGQTVGAMINIERLTDTSLPAHSPTKRNAIRGLKVIAPPHASPFKILSTTFAANGAKYSSHLVH
jgi:hypothetical protein